MSALRKGNDAPRYGMAGQPPAAYLPPGPAWAHRRPEYGLTHDDVDWVMTGELAQQPYGVLFVRHFGV
jgi:hypothetical protein